MLKGSTIIVLTFLTHILPTNAIASTCYGKANCKACRTCNSCKHCNEGGGTCGVCGGGERETITSETYESNSTNTPLSNTGSNLGTTLIVGAGVAGAAYYMGKASRKK